MGRKTEDLRILRWVGVYFGYGEIMLGAWKKRRAKSCQFHNENGGCMKKIAGLSIIGVFLALFVIAAFPQYVNAETIYGCVAKNGTLSIVNGPDQCSGKGTPLTWNAVDGVTAAVHGVVLYDGSVESGVGFTSRFENNVYYITFDQAFSDNPHCVITPNTSPPVDICTIVGYGPSVLDVNCINYTTSQYVQVSFSFICML
jgi:hypothetical protein